MPDPDSIRIIALIAFPIFFVMGIFRPLYLPISFLILFLSKLSHYYPFLYDMRAESIIGIVSFIRIMAIKGSFERFSTRYNSVNKFLILFLASVMLSFVFALDHLFSWEKTLFDFIKVLLIYFMILGSINDSKELKIFIWSFVILFAYLAYEPLYGTLTDTGSVIQGYGKYYISDVGILSGHVAAANNMNQMIPIALFLFLSIQKNGIKVIGLVPVTVFTIVLVATHSRGGFIGFLTFCCITILLSRKHIKSGIFIGFTALVILVTSATFIYTASRITEDSISGRLQGLSHGIEMVLKGHPLGVGPGCFVVARSRYFGYTMMSHNIYGELIGDLGIPGTVAWFFLIRQVFLNLLYAKKKLESLSMQNEFLYKLTMGLLISLIVRLVISMGSHGLYYFYWYLIAAISVVVCKNVEKIEEEHTVDEKDLNMNRFATFKLHTPSKI